MATWWCPLTIASTFPRTASATPWISFSGGSGPACAQIRTTSRHAPGARPLPGRLRAAFGEIQPETITGLALSGVSRVASPMIPTFTPASSTRTLARSQSGRCRVP